MYELKSRSPFDRGGRADQMLSIEGFRTARRHCFIAPSPGTGSIQLAACYIQGCIRCCVRMGKHT